MKGARRNVQSIKDARKIKGNIVKYQLPCGIDNQEITAQIKNNFVVSNACHRGQMYPTSQHTLFWSTLD
jgi:hypothetical protein